MPKKVVHAEVAGLSSQRRKPEESTRSVPYDGLEDTRTPTPFVPSEAVTKQELQGWYIFDWANSVYSTIIISGFLPLLLQSTALVAAGFPDSCPNVLRDAAEVRSVFPAGSSAEMYIAGSMPSTSCGADTDCRRVNGTVYCPGLPDVVSNCRSADGAAEHRVSVSFGVFDMDPTAYASTFIGISVLFQAVTFVSISALADFGSYRKRLLIITSTAGALSSLLCVAVVPATWWLGGILTIVSNVFYGATFIFYNAYLPILASAHPDVLAKTDKTERDRTRTRVEERISATGFAYGYVGAVLLLIVCIALGFFISSEASYRVNIALAGAWWLFFSMFTFRALKNRPGPQLPSGSGNYVAFSWRRAIRTLRNIKRLPRTFTMLVCWFCYSDGFSVISSLGALFANSETDWGCFPKTLGIGLVFLEVPVCAALGCIVVDRLAEARGWRAKSIVISVICTYFALGLYTIMGFFADIGLKHGWELFVFAFVYGTGLGAIQSYSRALFSSLIPPGLEGEFFGFFEITDKGSSWMGPVAIGLIQQMTGEIRYGIFYVFFMMALPLPFLARLDVDAGVKEARAHSQEAHAHSQEAHEEDMKVIVAAPHPTSGAEPAVDGKNGEPPVV